MSDAPKDAPKDAPAAGPAGRPLATFFVLAYKQQDHVRAAIESAFAQTYQPLEIILSDDRSPDGTFAVMEEMAAAYDGPHRVVLNRNPENLGLVRHVDRLMELASGELIVQNAGDDVSLPERTERLVEAWLASGGAAKVLHSQAVRIDENGAPIGLWETPPRTLGDPSPEDILRWKLYILGAASAWTRDVFERFGPLGERLSVEDNVIAFRGAILGEIRHVPEPLVRWRVGGLSAKSSAETGEEEARNELYGSRLTQLRWLAESQRKMLEDLEKVAFPERDRCRRLGRLRLSQTRFELGCADGGRIGRLLRLPLAAALTLRYRDRRYLEQAAKYAFDDLYIRALGRRRAPIRTQRCR